MRRSITVLLMASLTLVTIGCCGPQVPDVKGLTLAEATKALEAAGFEAAPPVYDESAQGAPGAVIRQDPAGGSRAKAVVKVLLTIAGPAPVATPSLIGLSATEASAALGAVGLTLGDVTDAYDASAPSGKIVSQEPSSGAQVPKGSTVAVTVSKGVRPVDVPDVVGKDESVARDTLEDAGLKVKVKRQHSTVRKGRVIDQSPRGGTAAPGSTVTITVSEGISLVTVPRVIGKDSGDAASALIAAGLRVRNIHTEGPVESGAAAYGPGQVYRQVPAAGTRVRRLTVVTIRSYLEPGI